MCVRYHNPGNQHFNGVDAEQDPGWRESSRDQDAEGRVHPDKPGKDIRSKDDTKDIRILHGVVVNVNVVSDNGC